ncbi:circularly permuted type 2 ATP-grasp protein [Algoriphagus halophytocola]|uniref:Circularly permuted type 2 ATP-grasp protein n=1 Tax=Algoriphagus halophytocola TaxID=2991499 RepID=A0ABY6MKU3_9BACT|nr:MULTISPECIES: circularly permuted type 2 ATP-grasp protein [unclassified Algoriphagus]UZD23579.1 circularly permuted type 2 ATP-grasp protein [Algoriphagus sp. TR-M5]WBL44873.1 circularly permuted type 2 ATP-grasp protein [Algoriphagus sp. TR-M9]
MFNNAPFLDEMATDQGKIQPHWERIAKYYEQIGSERMAQFHEEVGRQLRENGVTYNVYGDPDGMNRPWILDPVPMVFSTEEWEGIEKGLIQRTQLLNLILRDLYGDQSLIKEGHIPFELVYNHRGFLRQAHHIKLDGEQQLIQYSSDLARGPNGKMWVLHDRTDAPSGAGYTFENRAAMTRVFPDLIRENHVSKITSYYQTFKNTLSQLTTNNKENPRVVLLSPGPTNETFFEHAYISSFMGFTLAFGEDLTVSDGYVWLKTIKGLEKVDVIIRRVDDVFCDPLEFRSDSHLGVVGLMEAIRQRKVLVINPLGCRVMENPGLMAFLPKICKYLLGEDLALPSVATWWCGQPKEMAYVFDHIETLVIRNIYRGTNHKSIFGGNLTKVELEKLKKEILQSPYMFVGQEMVEFSTTPSWINQKLEARNAVFRSYVVADSENNSYKVMPGGLSRSSPEKGAFLVSNQTGGISKDTWILGKAKTALPTSKPIKIQPLVRNVLPSRTGERLFWLGRYLERAAYTVRLMRMTLLTYNEADEDIHLHENPVLSTLLRTLTVMTDTLPGFTEPEKLKNPEGELLSLVYDSEKSGSLAFSIQCFLSNAFAVRDRLSLDTWRILDSISEELHIMKKSSINMMQAYQSLDNMVVKLMAFYGLNIDNMTREPTWHLLNIGRFIESAANNCTILREMLATSYDVESNKELMEDTLRCNESLVTYRYRYRSNLEMHGVLSLLILHEDNPRALVFQLKEIDKHLKTLGSQDEQELFSNERKSLLDAITKIRLCDMDELCALHPEHQKFERLVQLMDEVIALLHQTSDIIYEKYFSHTGSGYQMIQSSFIPEI